MADDMEEEFKIYREDKRIPCRYGVKCFQKNLTHHEKYKHPPGKNMTLQKKAKGVKRTTQANKRKRKDDNQTNVSPKNKLQKQENDIYDNDLENALNSIGSNFTQREDNVIEHNSTEQTRNSNNQITILSLLRNKNINIEENKITLNNAQTVISELFLVKMPKDFFQLYTFCKNINETDPFNALKEVDLELVGCYDVFRDNFLNFKVESNESLLRHWRYYYDPPEFQTIMKDKGKDGLHYGYWRDDTSELPAFIAGNRAALNCLIEPAAENLFGTLDVHITEKLKLVSPFEKTKINRLQQALRNFAKEANITMDKYTPTMKARERKVVARTLHKAGIVVPYNKHSQLGYRELSVTDNELWKILKQLDHPIVPEARKTSMSKLEEVVRLAVIAADECDFGTVLELGHDLFSSGVSHVQNKALNLLSLAYNLLHRTHFLEIFQAHLKNRTKSLNPSVLKYQ